MGKIGQGILGGLSGKVGNIVGASWKGINYIRIKPVSVANPRTEGQVNQRNKFSATLEFLQPSLAFLKVGYKYQASKKSAFNAAMSYILKNAITGSAPDFTVDYPEALVSRGSLTGALNPTATITGGMVDLSWEDNSTDGNARPGDKLMFLAYNPVRKESSVYLEAAETRINETALLALPESFSGDTVHLYIAFQAADGSSVSNSVYVGEKIVE